VGSVWEGRGGGTILEGVRGIYAVCTTLLYNTLLKIVQIPETSFAGKLFICLVYNFTNYITKLLIIFSTFFSFAPTCLASALERSMYLSK
jgi:hypothetical protein